MTSNPYGPRFWATWISNTCLMVAVSLLFRYADFVSSLGGTEDQLGMITGIGMVGAIVSRCFLGVAIDRYGAGRVWALSLLLLATCLLGHLAVRSLQPPLIHALRIAYTISLAGAFGASITFVSLRAPPDRMGEMIGMLGSSGFVGMAIGPAIGDWLFAGAGDAIVSRLFYCSSISAIVALVFAWMATARVRPVGASSRQSTVERVAATATDHDAATADDAAAKDAAAKDANTSTDEHDAALRRNPLPVNPLRLVRQYHPGWTLLVGMAMGFGIGMPGTFLSAFAAEKHFSDLGWFWIPYAMIAFVVRILTRRLADRWGTRPTILTGLACIAASMFAYLLVNSEISLLIPAALGGTAHAFLFPAAMAEGNQSFPIEYRGLATTLMLTMFDLGMLIGQPVFGFTVEWSRLSGLNGYAVAFSGLAITMILVGVTYVVGKTPPGLAATGARA